MRLEKKEKEEKKKKKKKKAMMPLPGAPLSAAKKGERPAHRVPQSRPQREYPRRRDSLNTWGPPR